MTARRVKPIFTLVPGQTVNYPSRRFYIYRDYQPQFGNDHYKFIATRKVENGSVKARISGTYTETDLNDIFAEGETLYLLNRLGEMLDHQERLWAFSQRMQMVKRGIRAKVNRHLRRKFAAPAVSH